MMAIERTTLRDALDAWLVDYGGARVHMKELPGKIQSAAVELNDGTIMRPWRKGRRFELWTIDDEPKWEGDSVAVNCLRKQYFKLYHGTITAGRLTLCDGHRNGLQS